MLGSRGLLRILGRGRGRGRGTAGSDSCSFSASFSRTGGCSSNLMVIFWTSSESTSFSDFLGLLRET